MRPQLTFLFTITCLAAAITVPAQDPAEDAAAAVAPFLDEQTIAIAYLGLEELQVPAAIGELLQAAAVSDQERQNATEIVAAAQDWLEQVRAAGVEHLFVVFSIADFPRGGPFLVASFGDQGNLERIGQLLGGRLGGKAATAPGPFPVVADLGAHAVVAGQPRTVERLREQLRGDEGTTRPERLTVALGAVEGSAARLVLIPSDEHRRVVREMLPALDGRLEGISGETVAGGLLWAAIGFDPAQPSLHAVMQSQNEVAAARLAQAIHRGLDLASQLDQVRQAVDDPQQVFAALDPTLQGDRIVWKLDTENGNLTKVVQQVLSPPIRAARAAAQRAERMNRLRQIGIAMHNHHDVHKSFPPQAIRDEQGKPLLSWRVAIVPFVGQRALYEQFRLDEPWDSPHNIHLVEQMPQVYADPALPELAAQGKTTYQVPVHEETLFPPGRDGIEIEEIQDGTSKTVMMVEVVPGSAVPWTKPDDWQVDRANPLAGLQRHDRGTFTALYGDASVHTFANEIDPELFWKMLTRAGGEPASY